MKGKRRNKVEENRKRKEMRKRGHCAFLVILLIISTCLMPKVQVEAESIYDLAEELGTDESVSCYPTSSNKYYYKVTLQEKGLLTLNIESKQEQLYIYLYDEDGKCVARAVNISSSKGTINTKINLKSSEYSYECWWNSTIERIEGFISWELAKGTYYFGIWSEYGSHGDIDTTLATSFKSTASKAATSVAIQLELSVGSTLKLNAILNPTDSTSKITWKSSKKSVCKVSSKGKVTAVKEGTCTIYAIANGHKAKIRIKVVE